MAGDPKKPVKATKSEIIKSRERDSKGNASSKLKGEIHKVQSGITHGTSGEQGYHVYYKDPTKPGFNVNTDREFINNDGYETLRKTPEMARYLSKSKNG